MTLTTQMWKDETDWLQLKSVINIDRMKFKTAYQYSMIVYIAEKVNQEFSITSMSIFTVIELIISSVVEFQR